MNFHCYILLYYFYVTKIKCSFIISFSKGFFLSNFSYHGNHYFCFIDINKQNDRLK